MDIYLNLNTQQCGIHSNKPLFPRPHSGKWKELLWWGRGGSVGWWFFLALPPFRPFTDCSGQRCNSDEGWRGGISQTNAHQPPHSCGGKSSKYNPDSFQVLLPQVLEDVVNTLKIPDVWTFEVWKRKGQVVELGPCGGVRRPGQLPGLLPVGACCLWGPAARQGLPPPGTCYQSCLGSSWPCHPVQG